MSTYTKKATAKNIQKKINRRRNPVTTLTGLAEEFGAPVYRYGKSGKSATSGAFRLHVIRELGEKTYKRVFSR